MDVCNSLQDLMLKDITVSSGYMINSLAQRFVNVFVHPWD